MSGNLRRLALLGGSFDPVHNGHLALARAFGQQIGADRVFLMPAKQPPHKPGGRLASEADRLAMCRLAVEGDALLRVSDLELRLPAPSYTVNTLRALRGMHPDTELFFLCGGDMLMHFSRWREYEQILRLCTLCAAARGEDNLERIRERAQEYRALGGKVLLVPMEPVEISSTDVRRRLEAGESIDGLVPSAVAEYIDCHGLYGVNSKSEE